MATTPQGDVAALRQAVVRNMARGVVQQRQRTQAKTGTAPSKRLQPLARAGLAARARPQ